VRNSASEKPVLHLSQISNKRLLRLEEDVTELLLEVPVDDEEPLLGPGEVLWHLAKWQRRVSGERGLLEEGWE